MPRELTSTTIETPRLKTHLRAAGDADKPALVLLHGNVSSSVFFERAIARLADVARVIAPDMRGFGDSQTAPVDATRGLRDFSDASISGAPRPTREPARRPIQASSVSIKPTCRAEVSAKLGSETAESRSAGMISKR